MYPVFLSRQTTQEGDSDSNYDESYIGIYKDKVPGPCKSDDETVVVNQSRRLLARDTTYLFIAMFILCLSESKNIKIDPLNYSIFNIVFEVTRYEHVGSDSSDLWMECFEGCSIWGENGHSFIHCVVEWLVAVLSATLACPWAMTAD